MYSFTVNNNTEGKGGKLKNSDVHISLTAKEEKFIYIYIFIYSSLSISSSEGYSRPFFIFLASHFTQSSSSTSVLSWGVQNSSTPEKLISVRLSGGAGSPPCPAGNALPDVPQDPMAPPGPQGTHWKQECHWQWMPSPLENVKGNKNRQHLSLLHFQWIP